jgi:phosphatidylcholine synthase
MLPNRILAHKQLTALQVLCGSAKHSARLFRLLTGPIGAMSYLPVWAVHLFTASGAALAIVAALAAGNGDWQLVFLCLGIALIVDGVDGSFARALNVKERLPWFDGGILDFVIDYTTYVFVPALVMMRAGLMPPLLGEIAGVLVAVVGALYFADTRMKTDDNAFRGFPAIWNIVAYLLLIYRPDAAVSFGIIAVLSVLTFVPIEFIHPLRVVRWRPLTIAVTILWGVLAIVALWENLDPGMAVKVAFAAASLYLAAIGIVIQALRRAG